MRIKLPVLLQPRKLKELNDLIFDKTQCFAFLQPYQTLVATHPASWQDAFSIMVIGLYSVYHDMGCRFLNLILSQELCPPSMSFDGRPLEHVININTKLRACIAHGLLNKYERENFSRILFEYTEKPSFLGKSLAEYVNSIDEPCWKRAVKRLLEEADGVYNYLQKWAEEWANNPDDLGKLQEKFCSSEQFKNSIDYRVCSSIVKNFLKKSNEIKAFCSVSNVRTWKNQLANAYKNKPMNPDEFYTRLMKIICEKLSSTQYDGIKSSSNEIAKRYGLDIK